MAKKRWCSISELAEELSIPRQTMLSRTRRIKAQSHVRLLPGGELSLDGEFFRNDHDRIRRSTATGRFGAKSPQERMHAQRLRDRKDTERRQGKKRATHEPQPLPLPDVEPPSQIPAEFVDHLDERRKWAAKIEQLKYRKLAGEFLLREAVKREAFEVARLARDQLLSIPDRLSGILAAEMDPHKVFSTLDAEIRRVLADLCDRVSKVEECDAIVLEAQDETVE
jgi:hypothetical protein